VTDEEFQRGKDRLQAHCEAILARKEALWGEMNREALALLADPEREPRPVPAMIGNRLFPVEMATFRSKP
jgi:hypothetical protein